MKIETMICDNCGQTCEGDYYTIFSNTPDGSVKGRNDICEKCFHIMTEALNDNTLQEGENEII